MKNKSFIKKYDYKILEVKNLSKLLGKFPRQKKTIMCHGVFDVVHPGHIRQFLYAKAKAEILIVSLTADKHINKGSYRPHVPQNLRAFNLAALDIVDYVIIDKEKEPIKNIKYIKPDYFIKGFEYKNLTNNVETSKEYDAVKSYKGRMIFSPGDIVYSSSKIINTQSPKITYEKIQNLMDLEKISFSDLRDTVKSFKNLSIHIVGDTIVDSYTDTYPIGGPVKYPHISVLKTNSKNFVGGAAIIASHIAQTGCKTIFTSVIGNDYNGKFISKNLKKNKVLFKKIIDKSRPTVNKNTILCKSQKILKIDTLDNTLISKEIFDQIKKNIKKFKTSGVIFSDFRHGIFNKDTIPEYISCLHKKSIKVADSQVASRWGNILDFKNFDIITPNEREARFSLGDQDSSIRPLATDLYKKSKCKLLILKLAEKGILSYRKENWRNIDSFYVLDSLVENLVDPVGAGDALISYATLSMCASNNHAITSIISLIAASLSCEKEGNVTIKITEILEKISKIERILK